VHDLADAVPLRPVLSERPRGRRENLLAGLGLLLRGISHAYKITIVIRKDARFFPEVLYETTEKYLGCKERIHGAVNDQIGIEP
jgi:hypothetical protein